MLRDDIDGGPADRTVSFVWAGAAYEIDLSEKNVGEFESILAPYVAAARRAGGRGGRRAGRVARRANSSANGSAGAGVDLAVVRSWASAHGHTVAARGRISAAVLDAYRADSSGASTPTRRRAATRSAAPRKRAKAATRSA
jgi:hypothetical protein